MSRSTETLTFATQGGRHSFHAIAAGKLAAQRAFDIDPKKHFGQVVKASRNHKPGLGIIAISTVAGTVEESAREIVGRRPSALPSIVARVDIPVELGLIGSSQQTLEELGRTGIRCLGQKPAITQCEEFLHEHMPWVRRQYRGETTLAVEEALAMNNPNYVAIGPAAAAEAMGGVLLASPVNPVGSITSFYALQRDPREKILPHDRMKTDYRTVISLAHPEGEGEIEKCWDMAKLTGVRISRFIRFNVGDFTKHDPTTRRGGGLLEVAHDIYDEEVTEFCARVHGIEARDGVRGPFDAVKLGGYRWYPEPDIDPYSLLTQ